MIAPSRAWATPSATTTMKSPTSITPSRTERTLRGVVVPVPVGETLVADIVITPCCDARRRASDIKPSCDLKENSESMGKQMGCTSSNRNTRRSPSPVCEPSKKSRCSWKSVFFCQARVNGPGLSLPTRDSGQQPHPGKDLWHRGGQGEAVGQIMIAPWTQLELQPPSLQCIHPSWIQDVARSAVLDHLGRGGDREGGSLPKL